MALHPTSQLLRGMCDLVGRITFLPSLLADGGTIIAPLLLTYMLLKFSGVSLLEETIVARRPAYQEYIERTNAFIPGPPKHFHKSTQTHEGAS